MSLTIGSNIASLRAQRQLGLSTNTVEESIARLSSGLRINRAADDPAGQSVASSLGARARVFTQAVRNINDGISALSIADSALGQLGSILERIGELANQASNGVLSRAQRLSLDDEAESLRQEFNRILSSTKFNQRTLLDLSDSSIALQAGFGSQSVLGFSIGDLLSRATGDGFEASSQQTISANAQSKIASADFNGDGIKDIVSTSPSTNTVNVAFGNGDGTFQASAAYATTLANALTTGDIDNDGDIDLIIGSSTNTFTLKNNGDGTFAAAGGLGGASASVLHTGDLNGDGNLDIVGMNGSSIAIRIGDGTGSFAAPTFYTPGTTLQNFDLFDATGDGILDVVYGENSSEINVVAGVGDGTLGALTQTTTGLTSLRELLVGDFNFDGIPDLFGNDNLFTGFVYLGNGDGTFTQSDSIDRVSSVSGSALGDFNSDGIIDIAWRETTGKFVTYHGNGDGTFQDKQSYTTTSTGSYALAADFNGDGVDDLVFRGSVGTDLSVNLTATVSSTEIQRFNLTTQEAAQESLGLVESAQDRVRRERGNIGASLSRSEKAVSVLQALGENFITAKSRITDADIADETAQLVRAQILQQSGAAVLAQANQSPQLVLDLLKSSPGE